MIKKRSQFGASETLDRLEAKLNEKGIKAVARVNHAAAAATVNLVLRPTQVLIFGNPALGTPLIQANQLAGLDLPMRVLAYEAEDGVTWVCYHSPQQIVDGLALEGAAEAAQKMVAALDALTDFATGGP